MKDFFKITFELILVGVFILIATNYMDFVLTKIETLFLLLLLYIQMQVVFIRYRERPVIHNHNNFNINNEDIDGTEAKTD